MARLIEELKRRNVFKVGAAYVVLAWLIAQAIDVFLENFGAPDWVIKTVLMLLIAGFPLALFFAWAFELTPEGIKKEKDVDRSQSITHKTGRQLDHTIIAVLLVALGYFAFDKFVFTGPESDSVGGRSAAESAPEKGSEPFSSTNPVDAENIPTEKRALTPLTVTIDPKSIAVLPFVNMSSDPEQEYFSDGISEEILNALARVDELKVAGRTSSFAFKGRNEDIKTIGEALRVANVLEGSVRKSGNKLRITAQLIKVDDGYHLWSETFDREMTDVFAIQDEIANAILTQLKAKLLGTGSLVVKHADTEAYAQYLLAKQRMYDRSQASLELAAELLNEAITKDPGFAAAYAQLGITTLLLADDSYGDMPNEQSDQLGRQHLEKALALDPNLAEAMAGMGLYFSNQPGGAKGAISWLERSLAADPNQASASTWLANALDLTGQIRAAIEIREREFARDPLYMPVFNNLVLAYGATNQAEKARQVLDQLEPYLHDDANMMLTQGSAYQNNGQWAEADRAFTAAREKEPRNEFNNYGLCLNFIFTAQYERCADVGTGSLATLALVRMGKIEEGLIAGYNAASKGQYPAGYFQALVETGRYQELVQFVEDRWADLAAFENDFSDLSGYGSFNMAFIAEAYRHTGQEAQFTEALQRAKAANDAQLAEGADNWSLSLVRAQIAMLSGNPDEAISLLERAFDQGLVTDFTVATAWPVFRPLQGDPRFEAARAKMMEHMNTERAALGLEPLST